MKNTNLQQTSNLTTSCDTKNDVNSDPSQVVLTTASTKKRTKEEKEKKAKRSKQPDVTSTEFAKTKRNKSLYFPGGLPVRVEDYPITDDPKEKNHWFAMHPNTKAYVPVSVHRKEKGSVVDGKGKSISFEELGYIEKQLDGTQWKYFVPVIRKDQQQYYKQVFRFKELQSSTHYYYTKNLNDEFTLTSYKLDELSNEFDDKELEDEIEKALAESDVQTTSITHAAMELTTKTTTTTYDHLHIDQSLDMVDTNEFEFNHVDIEETSDSEEESTREQLENSIADAVWVFCDKDSTLVNEKHEPNYTDQIATYTYSDITKEGTTEYKKILPICKKIKNARMNYLVDNMNNAFSMEQLKELQIVEKNKHARYFLKAYDIEGITYYKEIYIYTKFCYLINREPKSIWNYFVKRNDEYVQSSRQIESCMTEEDLLNRAIKTLHNLPDKNATDIKSSHINVHSFHKSKEHYLWEIDFSLKNELSQHEKRYKLPIFPGKSKKTTLVDAEGNGFTIEELANLEYHSKERYAQFYIPTKIDENSGDMIYKRLYKSSIKPKDEVNADYVKFNNRFVKLDEVNKTRKTKAVKNTKPERQQTKRYSIPSLIQNPTTVINPQRKYWYLVRDDMIERNSYTPIDRISGYHFWFKECIYPVYENNFPFAGSYGFTFATFYYDDGAEVRLPIFKGEKPSKTLRDYNGQEQGLKELKTLEIVRYSAIHTEGRLFNTMKTQFFVKHDAMKDGKELYKQVMTQANLKEHKSEVEFYYIKKNDRFVKTNLGVGQSIEDHDLIITDENLLNAMNLCVVKELATSVNLNQELEIKKEGTHEQKSQKVTEKYHYTASEVKETVDNYQKYFLTKQHRYVPMDSIDILMHSQTLQPVPSQTDVPEVQTELRNTGLGYSTLFAKNANVNLPLLEDVLSREKNLDEDQNETQMNTDDEAMRKQRPPF